MDRVAPELADVQHVKLCYSSERYCGHPRQLPFRNFGGGEIAVSHFHAPANYSTRENITHGLYHYKGQSQVLLQRSMDHGETWRLEDEVVVWDHSRDLAERRAIVQRADEEDVSRERIDLTGPDAMVSFARHATGQEDSEGRPALECFAFRSGDRGRTWETVPTRVSPPFGYNFVAVDGQQPTQFPDSTMVVPAWVDNRNTGTLRDHYDDAIIALYGSDDQGLMWKYMGIVARDDGKSGRPGYANLVPLPSGRLQCYFNRTDDGSRNAIELTYSDDGGYSWGESRPIVAWGQSPWAARHRPGQHWNGWLYRSPWPVRLRDGRIVVLFARRKSPSGIGLIVSEDDGGTWSAEAIVRDDGSRGDLGYPVATELDDGRILTAYYFMEDDGNNFGGTRHMAASFFRLS